MFTYELNRRLKDFDIRNITVNAVHPGLSVGYFEVFKKVLGLVKTQVHRNFRNKVVRWALDHKVSNPIMLTPEEGARALLYLSSSRLEGYKNFLLFNEFFLFFFS